MRPPFAKPPKRRRPRRAFNSTLPASTTPVARTPITRRNRMRHSIEWLRAFESVERVRLVKSLPCVAASAACRGNVENHHVASGGGSRKADARFIAPLCENHDRLLHAMGRRTFELTTNVHLDTAAAKTELAWQAASGSTE